MHHWPHRSNGRLPAIENVCAAALNSPTRKNQVLSRIYWPLAKIEQDLNSLSLPLAIRLAPPLPPHSLLGFHRSHSATPFSHTNPPLLQIHPRRGYFQIWATRTWSLILIANFLSNVINVGDSQQYILYAGEKKRYEREYMNSYIRIYLYCVSDL